MSLSSRRDEFHDLAMQATGFSDFGSRDYLQPMQRLLADYDAHARFTPLGAQMTEASIIGQLAGRLISQRGFSTHPEFAHAPIEKPIILTGMLRTGSTALLRLLATDPHNQWLPPWLASAPMPRPPREAWQGNPWFQRTAQGFAQMYRLSPEFQKMHPMAADEADECRFAMDQSFWSPGLACFASAPDYARWCLDTDAGFAYQRYRSVLGLIAAGGTQRWVLKDPCHLWGLDALLKAFPDACIVYTHRDPVTALTGAAAILYEIRRFTESLSREEIGRQELACWGTAQAQAEQVRKRHDPARFFDVHMRRIQADPMGTAESIYRYFGIPVSNEARHAWIEFLESRPDGGHSPYDHRAEDFGFSAADVHATVGEYGARYRQVADKFGQNRAYGTGR